MGVSRKLLFFVEISENKSAYNEYGTNFRNAQR